MNQFSQSPRTERVATATKNVQAAQDSRTPVQFNIGQYFDNLNPIGERHQYRVATVEIESKSPPHDRCPSNSDGKQPAACQP